MLSLFMLVLIFLDNVFSASAKMCQEYQNSSMLCLEVGKVMAQGLLRVQMSSKSFPICVLLHFEGRTSSRLCRFDHYPM